MSFRHPIPALDRYVLTESVLPFFLGFGLITFLFVIDFLFDYLDLILAKGVPPLAVGELFLLALGWITALSCPCGVLVGALMTFGRMAQDNEITAMRAMGVNVGRILRGPLGAGLGVGVLLALFNNYVLPETNHRFANLSWAIHRMVPAARIQPGIFIDAFDDYSLLVREIDDKTGEMRGIKIYDRTQGNIPATILAHEGHMQYISGGDILRIDLKDGEISEVPGTAKDGKHRLTEFDELTLYLRNTGGKLVRTERESRGEREMNVQQMGQEIVRLREQKTRRRESLDTRARGAGFPSYAAILARLHSPSALERFLGVVGGVFGQRAPAPPDSTLPPRALVQGLEVDGKEVENLERRINSYKVEIHKKFSIPFACIVFVLVGGPLGIRTRKGGFANMAIAVGFFIAYYLFLIAGEQLADRRIMSPLLAMWLPNLVFGSVGVYLTVSVIGWGPSRGMR